MVSSAMDETVGTVRFDPAEDFDVVKRLIQYT